MEVVCVEYVGIYNLKLIKREEKNGVKLFKAAVDSGKRALLVGVIGGKISEGISFNDDYGRVLLVVGLPFPNKIGNTALAERMKLLDRENKGVGGNKYFTNLCVRALNQTLGRIIRHRDDYGAIILADSRAETLTQALPSWVSRQMMKTNSTQEVGDLIGNFLEEKRRLSLLPKKD